MLFRSLACSISVRCLEQQPDNKREGVKLSEDEMEKCVITADDIMMPCCWFQAD